MTNTEPPWTQCNRLMGNFSYEKRVAAWIWAAREQKCPKCEQEPYNPCLNLTAVKKVGRALAAETRWPHTERVNWQKLEDALRERGYAE